MSICHSSKSDKKAKIVLYIFCIASGLKVKKTNTRALFKLPHCDVLYVAIYDPLGSKAKTMQTAHKISEYSSLIVYKYAQKWTKSAKNKFKDVTSRTVFLDTI